MCRSGRQGRSGAWAGPTLSPGAMYTQRRRKARARPRSCVRGGEGWYPVEPSATHRPIIVRGRVDLSRRAAPHRGGSRRGVQLLAAQVPPLPCAPGRTAVALRRSHVPSPSTRAGHACAMGRWAAGPARAGGRAPRPRPLPPVITPCPPHRAAVLGVTRASPPSLSASCPTAQDRQRLGQDAAAFVNVVK